MNFIDEKYIEKYNYFLDCLRWDWCVSAKTHKYPVIIKSEFIIKLKKISVLLLNEKMQADENIILNENDIKRTIFFRPETEEFNKRYMNNYKILAVNKTKDEIIYI